MKRTAALLAMLFLSGCASPGAVGSDPGPQAGDDDSTVVFSMMPIYLNTYFLYGAAAYGYAIPNAWSSALRGRTK